MPINKSQLVTLVLDLVESLSMRWFGKKSWCWKLGIQSKLMTSKKYPWLMLYSEPCRINYRQNEPILKFLQIIWTGKAECYIFSLAQPTKLNMLLNFHIHTIVHLQMKGEELQEDPTFFYNNYSSEASKEALKRRSIKTLIKIAIEHILDQIEVVVKESNIKSYFIFLLRHKFYQIMITFTLIY